MSQRDLKIPDCSRIHITSDTPHQACQNVTEYARGIAIDAFHWYAREKKRKQLYAKVLRLSAILITALAGVIPILIEMYPDSGYSPAWASLAVAMAGLLVLIDRFGGFSTGWPRFIDAMLHIHHLIAAFDLECARIKIECAEKNPSTDQTDALIECCQQLVAHVNAVVTDETRQWDREFKDVLNKLDRAAQKRGNPAMNKPSK